MTHVSLCPPQSPGGWVSRAARAYSGGMSSAGTPGGATWPTTTATRRLRPPAAAATSRATCPASATAAWTSGAPGHNAPSPAASVVK